jgi:hypothetical protein
LPWLYGFLKQSSDWCEHDLIDWKRLAFFKFLIEEQLQSNFEFALASFRSLFAGDFARIQEFLFDLLSIWRSDRVTGQQKF